MQCTNVFHGTEEEKSKLSKLIDSRMDRKVNVSNQIKNVFSLFHSRCGIAVRALLGNKVLAKNFVKTASSEGIGKI